MKLEDLQSLCDSSGWIRDINHPFIQGGRIYATNGKWCVRSFQQKY